jgi:hypothetical protein
VNVAVDLLGPDPVKLLSTSTARSLASC